MFTRSPLSKAFQRGPRFLLSDAPLHTIEKSVCSLILESAPRKFLLYERIKRDVRQQL